jgi:hypothetical protein
MRLDCGMDTTTGSLITTFDYVWDRLISRLNGLTDEEYFWEPVAGCWSVRQNNQGGYAESNTVDLALHVLDEVIHQGAEVGLLRDLYSQPDRIALRASCCYLANGASAESLTAYHRPNFQR